MALIDDIIADMALLGDAQPVGQSPSMLQVIRAVIAMGHRLHSDAGPDYWYNGLRADLRERYRNQGWWEKLQSWFVLKRTVDSNRFANVELQMKDVELYGFRQSLGTWVLLGSGDFGAGDYYPSSLTGNPYGPAPVRNAGDGGKIFTPSTNPEYDNIHGYGPNFIVTGLAWDIVGLHFRFKGRLIKKDPGGANDLGTARLILTSGLDVYPGADTAVWKGDFAPIHYVPSSGQGRYKWVTSDWALYSYTSVRADYDPMPSRPVVDGTTVASNAQRAASESWLRANPPPLDDIDPNPGIAALNLPSSAQLGSVVRARFVDGAGSPISGATVSWQGASGGVIYGGTTNDQGVVVVRVTAAGSYTLQASGGGVTATASITVTASYVTNAVTASETPTGWTLIGSGPTMTGGQTDIYGGTRWGLFTQGAPSGGDPSAVQYNTGASMLTSGRISGEVFVKKGNQDWVALYVFGSTSGPHASARGWFNVATGTLGAVESLGVGTNAIASIEPWGNGVYRIALSVETNGGGGDSMLLLRVDTGNQAYAFPSGATVTVGGGMLHLGAPLSHLPTDLVTAVVINAATLPMAQTGQPYAAAITCAGVPPITWSITGSLPAGITADTGQTSTTLTLSSASVTATTGATFTVNATDGTSSDSEPFTIPVGSTAVDPSGLAATATNSDTINLTWDLNGAAATSTVVEAQQLIGGDWTAWTLVAEVGPAETAAVVSGLRPHTQCRFRVFQRTATGQTGYTDVATATTERLRVVGHFEPAAAGVTGCMVTVGRGASPDTGLLFPLQVVQAFTGIAFDGPVTWTQPGDEPRQYARITVDLAEQPPGAKLRDGDRIEMVVQGVDGGKVYQSKILHGTEPSGAVVIEEP